MMRETPFVTMCETLIGKHLPGRAAARTGGDHFIIFAYSAEAQKAVFSIYEELQTMYMNHPVRIKAGQYDLKKRDSVALACDRAKTAEDSIKGTDRLLCV